MIEAIKQALRNNDEDRAFTAALKAARTHRPNYNGSELMDLAVMLINEQQTAIDFQTRLYETACKELGIPAY